MKTLVCVGAVLLLLVDKVTASFSSINEIALPQYLMFMYSVLIKYLLWFILYYQTCHPIRVGILTSVYVSTSYHSKMHWYILPSITGDEPINIWA